MKYFVGQVIHYRGLVHHVNHVLAHGLNILEMGTGNITFVDFGEVSKDKRLVSAMVHALGHPSAMAGMRDRVSSQMLCRNEAHIVETYGYEIAYRLLKAKVKL